MNSESSLPGALRTSELLRQKLYKEAHQMQVHVSFTGLHADLHLAASYLGTVTQSEHFPLTFCRHGGFSTVHERHPAHIFYQLSRVI
jgi:hypothetical protein